ncbi:unnamed protein product [Periconia digitata]|uniref:Uncharacterized protein n=1 Tax=Periconia digitata TaxID=1303443 RepID=A0A9W4UXI8_9PLEO|nr:unnamed protein product [Periconia digitata]
MAQGWTASGPALSLFVFPIPTFRSMRRSHYMCMGLEIATSSVLKAVGRIWKYPLQA